MTTLFGISNCDTVKKARNWLDQHEVDYQFHDFRKDGINQSQVVEWIEALGLDNLINKRSTTWKNLDESIRQSLDAQTAVDIILEQPTLIKRPLLERGDHIQIGFKVADYEKIFA